MKDERSAAAESTWTHPGGAKCSCEFLQITEAACQIESECSGSSIRASGQPLLPESCVTQSHSTREAGPPTVKSVSGSQSPKVEHALRWTASWKGRPWEVTGIRKRERKEAAEKGGRDGCEQRRLKKITRCTRQQKRH